ncbi:hypothetical protein AK812_SmicGene6693 [Symbiodinium microadriaticum]|uniref:Uncharacterized protein n=1 Tax=Symbiodinium microadriaticum TaxID=2951 RepID=A0A1Q9EQG3_SYMMI|nr:hypothetical protein AK812_SmicGene6693 [Symbiodinium microadriaticum]
MTIAMAIAVLVLLMSNINDGSQGESGSLHLGIQAEHLPATFMKVTRNTEQYWLHETVLYSSGGDDADFLKDWAHKHGDAGIEPFSKLVFALIPTALFICELAQTSQNHAHLRFRVEIERQKWCPEVAAGSPLLHSIFVINKSLRRVEKMALRRLGRKRAQALRHEVRPGLGWK